MTDLKFAFHQRLKNPGFTIVAVLTLALAATGRSAQKSDWLIAAPEEVGLDSTALVEMLGSAREREIPVHSIQLVRHGRLVLDSYFYPFSAGMRHDVASVTKSITSTLVGLAIERGYIRDVRQPVVQFFPDDPIAHADERKRRLTLEHLLTMQAGWDCGTDLGDPKINLDPRLAQMRRSTDWAAFALGLPMIAEPGTRFAYCNANCHLLSALIARTAGTNALGLARRELFGPLGIHDVAWPADPQGNNYGWGDLQLHPRDMARIGQLFLQGGRWDGRQVIPERWIAQATRAHVERTGGNDRYGYLWWVPGGKYPGVFEAVGRGGQRITVWPAKDLVLVYTGGGFNPDSLTPFILKALKSDKPLPKNAEALRLLRNRIAGAAKPPPRRRVPAAPPLASLISGKVFKLSSNTLDLSALFRQGIQIVVEHAGSQRTYPSLQWVDGGAG